MQLYELLSYLLRLFENDFNRNPMVTKVLGHFYREKTVPLERLVIE